MMKAVIHRGAEGYWEQNFEFLWFRGDSGS